MFVVLDLLDLFFHFLLETYFSRLLVLQLVSFYRLDGYYVQFLLEIFGLF